MSSGAETIIVEPTPPVVEAPSAPPEWFRGRAWTWLTVFVVVGLATAALAGWQWGRGVDTRNSQRFDQSATAVGSSIATVLQRDAALTAAIRTLVARQPSLTNAQLAGWFGDLAEQQQPETTGVIYVRNVARLGLYNFLLSLSQDPTSAFSSAAPKALSPDGVRPSYCLTQLMALRPSLQSAGDIVMPAGRDWCAGTSGSALQASAASGQPVEEMMLGSGEGGELGLRPGAGASSSGASIQTLRSLDQAFGSSVVIFEPVYGTATPATAAARQQALQGWVGGIFDTGAVLTAALAGHSDLQVSISSGNVAGEPQVVASRFTGTAVGASDTVAVAAGGRWLVSIRQAPVAFGQSGTAGGLEVGLAVALATLVLFLVLRALVLSRRRLLALVAEHSGALHHVALHDPLTGLPNRSLVVDRADQMLSRSRRSQLACAALAIGLDGFKEFNEQHGHPTGDALLRAVAERLRTVLREADTVGRVGDDEFIVLTDGSSLAAGPELVGERIVDVLREPYYLDGQPEPFTVTACVGIALGPRVDAEDLLRDAYTALGEAKATGAGRYSVFGQDMPQAVESRLAFENELRTAVAADQFFLRYQPIFDIESRTTTGVEALLRWQHPTRRVVPPDHFLPLLEESGLIIPLGRWVLHEACRQGASLHRAGYPITMSVNISAVQLESDTMISDVEAAIADTGFDAQALVLEITETTLMGNTELMVDRLVGLKALGVRIAIDDFGTGYSSLAYLRQFPIDILKIDRSFISSMANTRESSMLIHTLVQFAKTLGLSTIAEGIEEEGQIDPLLAEQCEAGQGFLYGRPLSPTQLDIFLRTHLTQDPPLWIVAPKLGVR